MIVLWYSYFFSIIILSNTFALLFYLCSLRVGLKLGLFSSPNITSFMDGPLCPELSCCSPSSRKVGDITLLPKLPRFLPYLNACMQYIFIDYFITDISRPMKTSCITYLITVTTWWKSPVLNGTDGLNWRLNSTELEWTELEWTEQLS